MGTFLSKHYGDTLDSKVIEVLEKFQVFEEEKMLRRELVQHLAIFCTSPSIPFMFTMKLILTIFGNGDL